MLRGASAIRRRAVALIVACGLIVAVPGVAVAVPLTFHATEQPFPGLSFSTVSARLADGDTVRGTLTRFAADDPWLDLRVGQSDGWLAGLEPVTAIADRVDDALVAVNGGFWVDPPDGGPTGRPHGLSVVDGRLETGGRTLWGSPGHRGAVGIPVDGAPVFSRLGTLLTLTGPDGVTVPLDEMNTEFLNRDGWTAQTLLYTAGYRLPVEVPAGGVAVTLDALVPTPGGTGAATVTAVRDGGGSGAEVTVPPGGAVVAAQAPAREGIAGLSPGDRVEVTSEVLAVDGEAGIWSDVRDVLPAGPTIVRDGVRTTSADWEGEGFSNGRHNDPRVARSAVARTGDGDVLLFTVDGRQPGWSTGMNMEELADTLVELGAVDALSLDGGGSTTAVVDGTVRNRPSGGDARPVANALVVAHSYDFAHSEQVGGADRYATAAALATATWPEGSPTAVLATGAAFPDALAGGPLAAALDAPLLLTRTGAVPDSTLDALDRLDVGEVVILGGESAVDPTVEATLAARGLRVLRVDGPDRVATAAAVASRLQATSAAPPDGVGRVVLATAGGFADALVAAAPAARLAAPILLTAPGELSPATATALRDLAPDEVVVVGGEAVVAPEVSAEVAGLLPDAKVERLAGDDRYGTAAEVTRWGATVLGDPSTVAVARGDNFPDALAGGPAAAARGALLTILPPGDLLLPSADSAGWLADSAGTIDRVLLLGGTAVFDEYWRARLDLLVRP